jgi:hypothetical protein
MARGVFINTSTSRYTYCVNNSSIATLTHMLLMSYIYMELLVKPAILTSYMYGLTFGNAESRLFLFAAQCFNTESI